MAWDAFISHATEDKETLALPLANRLSRMRFNVWLDRWELKPGDRLWQRIEDGIRRSRAAVVLVTEAYFRKSWTLDELAQIVEQHQGKMILVLGQGMKPEKLADWSPTLQDTLCVLATLDLDAIARTVAERLWELNASRGLSISSDNMEALSRIKFKGWFKNIPPGLVSELANEFEDIDPIKGILREARQLVASVCPEEKSLPLGDVVFSKAARGAWDSALHQAAMISPHALASILMTAMVHANSSRLPLAQETLMEILKAPEA